ncbi:MAG: S41 family peptidase [Firmicutes bacterium]|nr:S41 family peptidase [Bacillota bacterium]MCL5039560.1 S41 family peptidase [Bacillota bacterium]
MSFEEKRPTTFWSRKNVAIIAILLVLILSWAIYTGANYVQRSLAVLKNPQFSKLLTVIDLVQKNYVDPDKVNLDSLLEGAMDGVVRALGDPYSDYMTADEFKEMKIHLSGNFEGIGVTIAVEGNLITVIAPIKGTPAYKAGLKAGDRITKVDGRDIVGATPDQAAKLIRGPAGTPVVLTIVRKGEQMPQEITIVRAPIQVPSVDWAMLSDGIGYIYISNFNENTSKGLEQALKELRGQGMKGLLLDLRHDPGGYLDQAEYVAQLFVPQGPIVSTVDRQGNKKVTNSNSKGFDLPLVVLVDGASASASEIVAGAIKDRGAGILVGTKTFGKGTVQNIITLNDGSGLKITTQKYLTPSGAFIHGKGIEPNLVVELSKGEEMSSDPKQRLDTQVTKAIQALKEKMAGQ